ncbi:MAG TPA: glycosyltransferase family 4 protein, partial [Humidesulfovibrio sp.]|uniref:glycosyltransferase family 4 protein n=1 Tax=Humidesulfovibrio sp. TaxID=2910988 RepID=UPI002C59A67F
KDGSSVHVKSFMRAVLALGHQIEHVNIFSDLSLPRGKAAPGQAASRPAGVLWTRLREAKLFCLNFLHLCREFPLLAFGRYEGMIVRCDQLAFTPVLLARLFGIPLLLEVNSSMCYEQEAMLGKPQFSRISKYIERSIWRLAPRIATVSAELKGLLAQQGIAADKITVVPNGVDTAEFSPRPRDAASAATLGIADNDFVVGFSGSLQVWHGTEYLLDIVGALAARNPGHRYKGLILGDGQMRHALEEEIDSRGLRKQVLMCGAVAHSEMPRYLSLFDVALAPYPRMDRLCFSPLKVFEYLAMGIPTIGSDQGQLRELLLPGRTGALVSPGDVDGFVEAIERVANDKALHARLSAGARELVCTSYTWDIVARSSLALLAAAAR